MSLHMEQVWQSYRTSGREVCALRGVTLQVAAGEWLAVQGPSGCGKTTLLMVAGGLLEPDSGNVRLGGENLYRLAGDERARIRAGQTGFVFQNFHLVPYLSIAENVMLPTLTAGGPESPQRVADLLDHFGLAELAQRLPGELSSGERQRAALARALFHRPKLLLADEPTGNLDAANRDIVLGCLREVADAGTAVVLVTHDTQCARRADRVADMLSLHHKAS